MNKLIGGTKEKHSAYSCTLFLYMTSQGYLNKTSKSSRGHTNKEENNLTKSFLNTSLNAGAGNRIAVTFYLGWGSPVEKLQRFVGTRVNPQVDSGYYGLPANKHTTTDVLPELETNAKQDSSRSTTC